MQSTILIQGTNNLHIGTKLNNHIRAVITQVKQDLPPGCKILYVDDLDIQLTFLNTSRFINDQLKETSVLIQITGQNNALMLAIYVAFLISQGFTVDLADEVLLQNEVNKEKYIKYYKDLLLFYDSQNELFKPQLIPHYSKIQVQESSQILQSIIQENNFISSYIRPLQEYSGIFVEEEYRIESKIVSLDQSDIDQDFIDTEGSRDPMRHIITSRR